MCVLSGGEGLAGTSCLGPLTDAEPAAPCWRLDLMCNSDLSLIVCSSLTLLT